MMKNKLFIGKIIFVSFSIFLASSCSQLQGMLSSEQKLLEKEQTGSAVISGNVWYYDGDYSTDFSGTEGASLNISFDKKVAVASTNDGKSKLSGNISVTYKNVSGQNCTQEYKIENGKIILDDTDSDSGSVSAGELNRSGNCFRFNMTPVTRLLDCSTAKNNELEMSLNLSGFVCNEGCQKGRSVETLSKKLKIKPLYSKNFLEGGESFSSVSKTDGVKFHLPAYGKITLAENSTVSFTLVSGSLDTALTSSDFTVIPSSLTGLDFSCSKDLYKQSFTGKLTVSGIVPELNASSYTRSFLITFSNVKSTDNSISSDTEANPSSASGASFDISTLGVYNDSENLYVQIKFSNPPAFYNEDIITVFLDVLENTAGGSAFTEVKWISDEEPRVGMGSKIAFTENSSVEGQITTYVKEGKIYTTLDYNSFASHTTIGALDAAGSDVTHSYNSSNWLNKLSSSTVVYKIPMSDIGLGIGKTVYVYGAVSHHHDTKWEAASIADHIPAKAAKNSDGSNIESKWASNDASESYTINMREAFEYVVE